MSWPSASLLFCGRVGGVRIGSLRLGRLRLGLCGALLRGLRLAGLWLRGGVVLGLRGRVRGGDLRLGGFRGVGLGLGGSLDRKSTRLNSSHVEISYAVLCLNKKILYIIS